MLDPKEVHKIREIHEGHRESYEKLAEYAVGRCMEFRQRYPKVARMIFSREPRVKTLPSILQKIETMRNTEPKVQYEDLNDIVALTVLCPYESDVKQFIEWMKKAFASVNSDKKAYRVYDSGHRGYHYVVMLTDAEMETYPRFNGLHFEIQIKTLLQEAFDAKSHDLAYKPGHLEVGDELKRQFALLSASLNAIDNQTEFLKDLILADQRDLELHREASVKRYLEKNDAIARQLRLDPGALPSAAKIVDKFKKFRKKSKSITQEFCKFAAYCALKLDDELLILRAVEYSNEFVKQKPDELYRTFFRGTILWALSKYESAFEDLSAVADDQKNSDLAMRGMNNFLYCACDCRLFTGKIDGNWESKAARYFQFLDAPSSLPARSPDEEKQRNFDTRGFYLIVFGKLADDIDKGREMLRRAKANRTDQGYIFFYQKHNEIALKRLLKLSKYSSK